MGIITITTEDPSPPYLTLTLPLSFLSRPRLLYASTFCWISICGGRFLALFLEQVGNLSPSQIGLTLALQQLLSAVFAAAGGSWADSRERSNNNNNNSCEYLNNHAPTTGSSNHGRAQVLGVGVVLGTSCFLLHALVPSQPQELSPSSSSSSSSASSAATLFLSPSSWHILLQAMYAMATCLIMPVLDGMTISHLKDKTEEYGKERLYGAISWAVTNLLLSFVLDTRVGFQCLYPLTVVSAVGVLVSLWIYVSSSKHHNQNLHNQRRQCQERQQLHQNGREDEYVRDSLISYRERALRKRASDVVTPEDYDDNNLSETFDSDNSSTREGVLLLDGGDPPPADEQEAHMHNNNHHIRVKNENTSTTLEEEEVVVTLWTLVRLLLASSSLSLAFIVCVFCLATGQILVDSMVFLLFEYLGSSHTVMGWTVVLTVVFEIPIFHIAPALLERFGSHAMLLMAGACYIVRAIGYSLIPQGHVLYVLFLEPLHGITYACSQTASVDFAARGFMMITRTTTQQQEPDQDDDDLSVFSLPPGYEASAQGLLQLFKGAGSVTGLLLGGYAQETVGPRVMYRISAGVVAMGCVCFALTLIHSYHWGDDERRRLRRQEPSQQPQDQQHLHLHHPHELIPSSCDDDHEEEEQEEEGNNNDSNSQIELTATSSSATETIEEEELVSVCLGGTARNTRLST